MANEHKTPGEHKTSASSGMTISNIRPDKFPAQRVSFNILGDKFGGFRVFDDGDNFRDSFNDGGTFRDTFVDGGQFISNFNNMGSLGQPDLRHAAVQAALEQLGTLMPRLARGK
jgi:hypothetical protein